MNRKLKTISAALLAAAICASLTGCANNEKPNNGGEELTESNIESHLESLFGGGENSSEPETSEPEEYKPEMTDEIKNAALNSGLVQLNNDIFQRGGYMTAADFVEKYKDSYNITYTCPQNHVIQEAGTYDECKDYLVEYFDTFFENYGSLGRRWAERQSGLGSAYPGARYYLELTPKNGNGSPVIAYVVNATSPDEKITLDKAIVAEVSPNYFKYEFTTPEWIPMGFNDYEFDYEGYESENKSYTAKNIGETLESKGLKKNSEFEQSGNWCPSSGEPENYNTYWKGDDSFGCYVLGEENLFGAKPLYYYDFEIDPNTDKVEYASCNLEYFVKDDSTQS